MNRPLPTMIPAPSHRFNPKLLDMLPTYTRQKFAADLVAGVTVGLVALPLAMAFAISSGVRPEAGIYTAIVAGFIVSALGGSPSNAISDRISALGRLPLPARWIKYSAKPITSIGHKENGTTNHPHRR